MERETIKKLTTSYIEQDMGGQEIENPKCDFKSKWYDLKIPKDINEFLKDTSAIANTFGPDGFIIIGYDCRQKTFNQSLFSDSNLKDTSHITDLINKKIDRLFDLAVYDFIINENKISVIHIPASVDKPHVIRNYQTFDKNSILKEEQQHKIFVRKNTSTYPASKNDIELMFYDRKNITPDYRVLCSFHTDTFNINFSSNFNNVKREITGIHASMNLVLENLGKRPIAITEIDVSFSVFEDASEHEAMDFTTGKQYNGAAIIVQPDRIESADISFTSNFYRFGYETTQKLMDELNGGKKHIISKNFTLKLSTGKTLMCDLLKLF